MFFLYHRKTQPTGEAIAASLLAEKGLKPPHEGISLIRWGSRVDSWVDSRYQNVLNKAESINNASDKLLSLQLIDAYLKDNNLNGSVPDFDTSPEALVERVGYPILGRKINHSQGKDIKLCLQKRDYRKPRDYYVQYVPTVREFRIHVMDDKVIRVQGKFQDKPHVSLPWIRNHRTGYGFRRPRRRLNTERLEVAIGAVKALGLDFGAVDFIIGDDRKSYVLEVNSAPSCSPLTATEYVLAFQRQLNLSTVNLDAFDLLMDRENDELSTEEEEIYESED